MWSIKGSANRCQKIFEIKLGDNFTQSDREVEQSPLSEKENILVKKRSDHSETCTTLML